MSFSRNTGVDSVRNDGVLPNPSDVILNVFFLVDTPASFLAKRAITPNETKKEIDQNNTELEHTIV